MREGYEIVIERADMNYAELAPLYRQHYAEMQARLKSEGIEIGPYRPRLDSYFPAAATGGLINYVVRFHGKPVGYSNIYVTLDMHNSEPMAQEDTIYVVPEHRNGIGKELAKFILADLKQRGCKRVLITPVTDLRVGKIWQRMGFKPIAQVMQYTF